MARRAGRWHFARRPPDHGARPPEQRPGAPRSVSQLGDRGAADEDPLAVAAHPDAVVAALVAMAAAHGMAAPAMAAAFALDRRWRRCDRDRRHAGLADQRAAARTF